MNKNASPLFTLATEPSSPSRLPVTLPTHAFKKLVSDHPIPARVEGLEETTMGRSRKVETGHSLPIYSAPVPINVRCCSDSDIIIWRSEVTLSAKNRHHGPLFDHLVGAT